MRKMAIVATATLAMMVIPAWAGGQTKGQQKMCHVMVPQMVPCDQISQGEIQPVEKTTQRTDVVCKTECLSERAWQLSHSKCWWADSKDHKHQTERFCAKCGEVCKPRGFPKMGHQSKDTGEWTVFRFGHPND